MTATETSIDTLNDVTKLLIDSCQGYQKASELSDDNPSLQHEFQRRAADREALVTEFQTQVRGLGGQPVTDGGAAGKLHRGLFDFASNFRDDEKAAVNAVDDGEEYLANQIGEKLENGELTADARELLIKAQASAKSGESFAGKMENIQQQ